MHSQGSAFMYGEAVKSPLQIGSEHGILLRKESSMKKALSSLVIMVLLVLVTAVPSLAGGDQVRGDLAAGTAKQVQVQDPPPFQP
jgi:hypothetical protein